MKPNYLRASITVQHLAREIIEADALSSHGIPVTAQAERAAAELHKLAAALGYRVERVHEPAE